jgi:hypothetical protein
LGVTAVWHPDAMLATVERLLEIVTELAAERGWTEPDIDADLLLSMRGEVSAPVPLAGINPAAARVR